MVDQINGAQLCNMCGRVVPSFFHHVAVDCMGWPEQPSTDATIWYNGWEIGWDEEADKWAKSGWRAYKGGCDLGAPQESHADFYELLLLIDERDM